MTNRYIGCVIIMLSKIVVSPWRVLGTQTRRGMVPGARFQQAQPPSGSFVSFGESFSTTSCTDGDGWEGREGVESKMLRKKTQTNKQNNQNNRDKHKKNKSKCMKI